MPRFNAKTVTILTVRDPVSSASWYVRVLGFTKTGQYPNEEPH